jgi:thioredoxin 1
VNALFLKLISALFLVAICFNNTCYAQNLPPGETSGMTYEQAMALNKPVVLEFYADWCGACKRFAPIFDSIKQDCSYKFTFVKVNVDQNKALSQQYNVTSLPSVFIVNPKTGESKFLNQSEYFDPQLLKKEFYNYKM